LRLALPRGGVVVTLERQWVAAAESLYDGGVAGGALQIQDM
jgi:hypothetical protein